MCLAMAAAVILTVFLASSLIDGHKDLAVMKSELAVSREHWESIAAEKEALLEEYKQLSNDLREADLTYEEETAKIAKYSAEIESLHQDIDELKKAIAGFE